MSEPNLDDIVAGLEQELGTQAQPPTPIAQVPEPAAIPTDPVEPIINPVVEPEPEPAKKVYANLEEYVADGNDPDYYQGPKAFEEKQQIITEKRETRDKLHSLENTLGELVTKQNIQLDQQKQSFEAQLAEAKENDDLPAYELAQNQLNNLNQVETPVRKGEAPIILQYRQTNPKLDYSSPQYDEKYTRLFEMEMNKSCFAASQRAGRDLTNNELSAHLQAAQSSVNAYLAPQPASTPSQHVSRVGTPTRSNAPVKDGLSKMNDGEKGLYNKWNNSSNPIEQGYAAKMKENYENM